jgi:hypothetical protein
VPKQEQRVKAQNMPSQAKKDKIAERQAARNEAADKKRNKADKARAKAVVIAAKNAPTQKKGVAMIALNKHIRINTIDNGTTTFVGDPCTGAFEKHNSGELNRKLKPLQAAARREQKKTPPKLFSLNHLLQEAHEQKIAEDSFAPPRRMSFQGLGNPFEVGQLRVRPLDKFERTYFKLEREYEAFHKLPERKRIEMVDAEFMQPVSRASPLVGVIHFGPCTPLGLRYRTRQELIILKLEGDTQLRKAKSESERLHCNLGLREIARYLDAGPGICARPPWHEPQFFCQRTLVESIVAAFVPRFIADAAAFEEFLAASINDAEALIYPRTTSIALALRVGHYARAEEKFPLMTMLGEIMVFYAEDVYKRWFVNQR